ncbi:ribbon-helix-helix domain-containing protein [Cylindrospermopsis raciborskii]|uniref:ribbon-helix-helix domain-containing protein n=1 Tax=Cylindrospermopsis raciborskii TaxID=77022 RepID=UPI001F176467|nr:ribbon-helix-helix domain-containing protein [Cylindrospermopsis raciborskii]
MKSINISLPDTMRAYIEELVAQGGYSSEARILSGISATRSKTKSKRTTTNHAFRRFKLSLKQQK